MLRHWQGKRLNVRWKQVMVFNNNTDDSSQVSVDPTIKKKLIDLLTKEGKVSSLDMMKKKDYLTIRFALAELYNNGFLYTQILKTPEHLIATTDKQLYRVYITTQKFKDAVEKGDKIE